MFNLHCLVFPLAEPTFVPLMDNPLLVKDLVAPVLFQLVQWPLSVVNVSW